MTLISSTLLQTASSLAGGQDYPASTLYVVATPIGNLADLTLRCVHLLSLADAIACEDTRHTAALMRHLGLDKPLISLHQHNEHEAASGILERLARGERIAYVSDAGTPAISDPGAVLVAAAQAHGFRTLPLPGASSVVTALSVAGDCTTQGFCFVGFLPAKGAARQTALDALCRNPQSQVLFEAPHRIESLAASLSTACGARRLTLCRELTKQFETVHTLWAHEFPHWLTQEANRSRGEFVLVLHSKAPESDDSTNLVARQMLGILLKELPLKQAVSLASQLPGTKRNTLYAWALEQKEQESAA